MKAKIRFTDHIIDVHYDMNKDKFIYDDGTYHKEFHPIELVLDYN